MACDYIAIKLFKKKSVYIVCCLWKGMFIPYCIQYWVETKNLKTMAASVAAVRLILRTRAGAWWLPSLHTLLVSSVLCVCIILSSKMNKTFFKLMEKRFIALQYPWQKYFRFITCGWNQRLSNQWLQGAQPWLKNLHHGRCGVSVPHVSTGSHRTPANRGLAQGDWWFFSFIQLHRNLSNSYSN